MSSAQLELFSVPTPPPPSLPDGARWRTVATQHQTLGFVLKRSRRRSIGLVIDDHGLRVTAPLWATTAQIDAAVVARSRWILEKLRLRQQRLERQEQADTLRTQMGRLPYMGAHVMLARDASLPGTRFQGQLTSPQDGDTLWLALPDNADSGRVSDAADAWLQQQAIWWFGQRLNYFVERSGKALHSWALSSATTRWGSCSRAGRIMLNWRLIHFKHEIIDYVIAHEVAHLTQMNHSKAFWTELERLLPNFGHAKAELRQYRPGVLPLL